MEASKPTPAQEVITASHLDAVHDEHSKGDAVRTGPSQNAVLDIDAHDLPKGYFYSKFFLGTLAALCCNLTAAVGGFALLAPILGHVNADIGPDPNIIWVALTFTLTLAIGLALVGRLSDLFGRRYFFIGGNILALVGCIICCTAKTVPVLIGGETLVGLGAVTGTSYAAVLGEIVPLKYRFYFSAFAYVWQLPTSGFGAAMAYVFILNTSAGWRWCYYYLIMWNVLALVLFVFFYFPPTFEDKHGKDKIWKWVKRYDYLGTILFIVGMVLFLMGLTWGGTVYPWRSGRVIATIVVGAVTLVAFLLYESLAQPKEPFVPMYLFKHGSWVATIFLICICGGVFYAFALVWPQMVNALYARPDDPMDVGYLSSIVALGIITGEIVGCWLAKPLGKTKIQMIVICTIGSTFLSCMATCDENTRSRAIALLFLGTFFIGWVDGVAIAVTTIDIPDQGDIGIATGVMGALRSVGGSICASIYTVVLTNRLAHEIPANVVPAITEAGLPMESVASFIQALTLGNAAALSAVEGVTPAITIAGTAAYKHASANSYRTVFLTSIAFSCIAIGCACFTPNVDHRMTNELAVVLHRGTARQGLNENEDEHEHEHETEKSAV